MKTTLWLCAFALLSAPVQAAGNPLQQAMAQRRMMEAVPGADVIVTNPTHYAVALKYSAGRMRATSRSRVISSSSR